MDSLGSDFSLEGQKQFYKYVEAQKQILSNLEDGELKTSAYEDIEKTERFYASEKIRFLNNKIQKANNAREFNESPLVKEVREINENLSIILENTYKNADNYLKATNTINNLIKSQGEIKENLKTIYKKMNKPNKFLPN